MLELELGWAESVVMRSQDWNVVATRGRRTSWAKHLEDRNRGVEEVEDPKGGHIGKAEVK